MDTQRTDINRNDLAKFIKDPRTIRAFEALGTNQQDQTDTITNLQNAPIVGAGLSAVFSADRQLAGSTNITLTDGGPKGLLAIDLSNSGIAAGTYGLPNGIPQITFDAKGRATSAGQITLNTDNITEGATNLFFTNTRARNALNGGTGINYNSGTGAISLDSGYVASGTYTPTLTNVLNIDTSTVFVCQYLRVGNVVAVSGVVNIDPTALAATQMNMSLPIASNFVSSENCGGTAYAPAIAQGIAIYAQAATDTARFEFLATTTANTAFPFSFTYSLLP